MSIFALPDREIIMPYRDYACRIEHGGALGPIYDNFINAWHRADPKRKAGDKVTLVNCDL